MPNPQPELERGAFRAWLASLPANRRVLRKSQDLFERFLRANGGDRRAGLVETFDAYGNSEGWQHYRAGGGEEETMEEQEVTVTLRFKSKEAKDYFMGGLSDGFGENSCNLEWPHREGVQFFDCAVFDVVVFDYDGRRVGEPSPDEDS